MRWTMEEVRDGCLTYRHRGPTLPGYLDSGFEVRNQGEVADGSSSLELLSSTSSVAV